MTMMLGLKVNHNFLVSLQGVNHKMPHSSCTVKTRFLRSYKQPTGYKCIADANGYQLDCTLMWTVFAFFCTHDRQQ